MALSNILREPRREITESTVGILITATCMLLFLGADYKIVAYLGKEDLILGMIIMGLVMALGMLLIFGIIIGTHALGESICNRLEDAGIHLRPRNRR